MLMAVQLRSARGFGVIAVPNLHVVQSNRRIEMPQSRVETFFADNVVSSDMRVTGIDASSNGNDSAQPLQHFRNLLKASAKRELRTGSVLDQNGQAALGQIKPFRRCGDGRGRAKQSLFTIGATK